MAKLLNEKETKTFLVEETAKNFFTAVCDADIWKRVYTREVHILPVDNAPILMQEIRTKMNIDTSVSDESMQQCMEENNLCISIPMETKYSSFPMGETAISSVIQRAGYQASPVLTLFDDKQSQKIMAPVDKAVVLNMGFSCYKNSSLALIRDEKLRALLSGDEADYSPIRFDEIFYETKTGLEAQFQNVKFMEATASHEYFTTTFEINDGRLSSSILDVFQKAGINVSGMTTAIRVVSSDIGISGANIYPLIRSKYTERILGLPLVLTHKHKHSINDFSLNIGKVLAMFKDAEAKLSVMQNTLVKNPAGCLLRIAKQVGLPKKLTCEAAPLFEDMYRNNTYQTDVYWKLFEILDDYIASSKVSESRKMQLEENICRIAFSNMEDYDMPFQWE